MRWKQWGRRAADLPAFIIKRLPFRFVYDNNYFNDRYQGIPEGGFTALVQKLLEGSDVQLGVDFLKNRQELTAKAHEVIYTGLIDEYFGYELGELVEADAPLAVIPAFVRKGVMEAFRI